MTTCTKRGIDEASGLPRCSRTSPSRPRKPSCLRGSGRRSANEVSMRSASRPSSSGAHSNSAARMAVRRAPWPAPLVRRPRRETSMPYRRRRMTCIVSGRAEPHCSDEADKSSCASVSRNLAGSRSACSFSVCASSHASRHVRRQSKAARCTTSSGSAHRARNRAFISAASCIRAA